MVFGGPGVGSSGIIAFPVLMAPMALNWMVKIIMITVVIPSVRPGISMAMGMMI